MSRIIRRALLAAVAGYVLLNVTLIGFVPLLHRLPL